MKNKIIIVLLSIITVIITFVAGDINVELINKGSQATSLNVGLSIATCIIWLIWEFIMVRNSKNRKITSRIISICFLVITVLLFISFLIPLDSSLVKITSFLGTLILSPIMGFIYYASKPEQGLYISCCITLVLIVFPWFVYKALELKNHNKMM